MKILILLVLLVACAIPRSYGHNIEIIAGMEGTKIFGYVYFSGGERVGNASVRAFAADGSLIMQKRANKDGEFQITIDQRKDLTLVAEKDGHRAQWSVTASEIPEPLTVAKTTGEESGSFDWILSKQGNEKLELRRMIREELKPLEAQFNRRNEEFERFRNEIRWRDVVGGIGYLLGIAGIFCFMGAKKKQRQE